MRSSSLMIGEMSPSDDNRVDQSSINPMRIEPKERFTTVSSLGSSFSPSDGSAMTSVGTSRPMCAVARVDALLTDSDESMTSRSLTSGDMNVSDEDETDRCDVDSVPKTSVAVNQSTSSTTILGALWSIDSDENVSSCILSNDNIFVTDEYTSLFGDEDDDDDCYVAVLQFALSQLSESEMESAACSSLQYEQWLAHHISNGGVETAFERTTRLRYRNRAAADVMRRNLIGTGMHVGQAVRNCRATVQFREQHGVGRLRRSLRPSFARDAPLSKVDDQMLKLNGVDHRGRVNIQIMARSTGTTKNSSLVGTIETLEKAMACVEHGRCKFDPSSHGSRDSSESIIVTVDFQDVSFVPWNTRLFGVVNDLYFLFRHHYTGQLWRVFLVDSPLLVRLACLLVQHVFIGYFYWGSKIKCVSSEHYRSIVVECDMESQLESSFRQSSLPVEYSPPLYHHTDGFSSTYLDNSVLHRIVCDDLPRSESMSAATSSSSDTPYLSPLTDDGSTIVSRFSFDEKQNVVPYVVHTGSNYLADASFLSERVEV